MGSSGGRGKGKEGEGDVRGELTPSTKGDRRPRFV